jgi:hypothetical protein
MILIVNILIMVCSRWGISRFENIRIAGEKNEFVLASVPIDIYHVLSYLTIFTLNT